MRDAKKSAQSSVSPFICKNALISHLAFRISHFAFRNVPMKYTRFEDMQVWRDARMLNRRIYEVSEAGLFRRDYGLKDQIRRASVSITSNIAEGFESQGHRNFIRFLSSARASSAEVRSQLYLAFDLNYLSREAFDPLISVCESISRQLTGLIKTLQSRL
jgi:four helix bundle protein